MKKLFLLILLTNSAHAEEASCLSKILYAESRGASLEGTMILGECAVTRAHKQSKSTCDITGVKRKPLPAGLRGYYDALSTVLLSNNHRQLSKGCDSWNRGTRPHLKGKITRISDGQVFYVMK